MSKQKGFGVVEIIIILVVLALVALGGWYVWQQNNKPSETSSAPTSTNESSNVSPVKQRLVNAQKDTQVKNDVNVAASAVTEYANNNVGYYPESDEDLATVKAEYLADFTSPLTGKAYTLTTSTGQAKGVINVLKGVCNDAGNGVNEPTGPRQYALISLLTDDKVYCVSL